MSKLTVYSSSGCRACVVSIAYLNRYGIDHEVIKIDDDAEAKAFILDRGHRTVPQFYLGDSLFVKSVDELMSIDIDELKDRLAQ